MTSSGLPDVPAFVVHVGSHFALVDDPLDDWERVVVIRPVASQHASHKNGDKKARKY
jgi:hypothetical protein